MAASDLSSNDDNAFIGVGVVYIKLSTDTFWRDMGEVPKFEFTPKVDSIDWFSHRVGIKTRLRSFVTQQTGALAITLQEGTGKNWCLALMGAETVAVNVTTGTLITSSGSLGITGLTPVSSLVANRRYRVTATGIPAGDTMVYNGGSTATLDAPATATGTVSGSGTITSIGAQSAKVFAQSQINAAIMFVGNNSVGAPVCAEFRNVNITPSAAIAMIQDANVGQLDLMGEVYQDAGGDFGHFDWNITLPYAPYLGL